MLNQQMPAEEISFFVIFCKLVELGIHHFIRVFEGFDDQ